MMSASYYSCLQAVLYNLLISFGTDFKQVNGWHHYQLRLTILVQWMDSSNVKLEPKP